MASTYRSVTEALAGKLPDGAFAHVPKSFDIIGAIAIIDVPVEVAEHELAIAKAVMAVHKHVTTVLAKDKAHGGEFRTQSLRHVVGEDTRETLVRENGYECLVDVEQVYFSPRLSTERLRVAQAAGPDERVLVLFSGCGPYVLALAKHSIAQEIVGVEKNPVGHRYAEENLRRNKIKNARVVCGDAGDLWFLGDERFDRIVMPHPSAVFDFVPAALEVASSRCTLHIYTFGAEDEAPALAAKIRAVCEEHGFALTSLAAVKAGRNKPYSYRWCFDATVEKKRAQ